MAEMELPTYYLPKYYVAVFEILGNEKPKWRPDPVWRCTG